jgi:hypothetical protein
MPSTITLTTANVVTQDGQNSSLIYNFPNSVQFKDHSICVQKISMYYAWTNINATPLGNNTFTYQTRTGAAANAAVTVTIPDGVYEISDLNNFLQYTFIAAGFYLVNSAGANVYYAEFLVNPTLYSVDINCYAVPTSLPAGFTQPAAWNYYGTQTYTPIITTPANFNKIMGQVAGFSTSGGFNLAGTATITNSSTTAPQVQPNPTIFLSASGIQNIYANPSSIIYSVTPTTAVGTQIVDAPNEYSWCKLLEGTYNELRFRFLGTNLGQLKILDPTMTITLLIRDNKMEGYTSGSDKQYTPPSVGFSKN